MPKDLEKAIEWLESAMATIAYQIKHTDSAKDLKDAYENMVVIYDTISSYENKKVLDNVFEDGKDGGK